MSSSASLTNRLSQFNAQHCFSRDTVQVQPTCEEASGWLVGAPVRGPPVPLQAMDILAGRFAETKGAASAAAAAAAAQQQAAAGNSNGQPVLNWRPKVHWTPVLPQRRENVTVTQWAYR